MTPTGSKLVPERPGVLLAEGAPAALCGRLRPPGDKSISHRALILATLAEGRTTIDGLLDSADVRATLQACRRLGAEISRAQDGKILVDGVGLRGLTPPRGPLDMGNSGTAMRLLAGVLAAQKFDSQLVGDASLSRRPMRRIIEPLRQMGAVVEARADGCAPLDIEGGHALRGIRYDSPVASAQVKSCVLLAGLYAAGETSVVEPAPSRDHTERMLEAFGAELRDGPTVRGGATLHATEVRVPADFSSGAFFLGAAAMIPGSRIVLEEIGLNPTRSGLVDALRAMGCALRVTSRRDFGAEPVGIVEVEYREPLHGIDLAPEAVPSMIDEFPVLAVVAACARGVTRIRGARELRVKESDRIAVVCAGLRALGVEARELPDGMDIHGDQGVVGAGHGQSADPVEVDAAGDHRCAMSFAILAQALGRPVRILGAASIDTSYPAFVDDLRALGGSVEFEGEGRYA